MIKGDVSDLDVLTFGGKPMIPLVSGFSRKRRSGVVTNSVQAGLTRQRKKFYGNVYEAQATFYLPTQAAQDFIKTFFARNEGKRFICNLSADRPIVEPYVVQVIGDWEDANVTSLDAMLNVTLEIVSVRCPGLDDFLFTMYQCQGDDMYCTIEQLNKTVDGLS